MTTPAQRAARELGGTGFVVLPDTFPTRAAAWRAVHDTIAATAPNDPLRARMPPLVDLAEYTMPTADAPGRPSQVLHFDFGLPLGLADRADVARYTGLYIEPSVRPSGAVTRFVRLADLAPQRSWPAVGTLAQLLRGRPDDPDAAEGVLARVVEAADRGGDLPDKAGDGFLCGLEFDSVAAETAYLREHGLEPVEHRVTLSPGRVAIFDNLACAHGREGLRSIGELHQLCVGHRSLSPDDQFVALAHALAALTGERAAANLTSGVPAASG